MSTQKIALESRIIALLQQRDKEAIGLLYEHYSSALYGIILRMMPSEAVAQEVLQDVFVKVWRNADKYDASKGKLFTWLAQITRNAARDTLRSRNYKYDTKTETLADSVTNDSSLSHRPHIQDVGLSKVIDGLDDKYKEIINLLYFQGNSHSEAAKILNIPTGTLKTRTRKAILELRQVLGDEFVAVIIILEFLRNNQF